MLLAKEQRIAAIILFGIVLIIWLVRALWPMPQTETSQKPHKKPWAERRDSIRLADSMRFEQWKADREAKYDSFFIADSIRHEQWKIERKARWDSMRRADSLWRDSVGIPHYIPHTKRDTVLDLNHCDTTELQLIRGIGRYTAIQIVRYREQLGGFYSSEQLKDEPLAKLSLDTLLDHFTADSADVTLLPVNSASVERLARHPYLRYEQAKAIYTLRRKRFRLKSIDDLHDLPELTQDDISRVAPYLSFE